MRILTLVLAAMSLLGPTAATAKTAVPATATKMISVPADATLTYNLIGLRIRRREQQCRRGQGPRDR